MDKLEKTLRGIVRQIYREVLVDRYKEVTFWVLSSFAITFALARLTVRFFPGTFLVIHSSHIHHFAYGFILLAISGYLSLVKRGRARIWLSCLYGVGLGLAVDESGMWLHLTNVYYNETSENIVIFIFVLLMNIVYLGKFWLRVGAAIKSMFMS